MEEKILHFYPECDCGSNMIDIHKQGSAKKKKKKPPILYSFEHLCCSILLKHFCPEDDISFCCRRQSL